MPVSSIWDTHEMRRNNTDCVGHRYPYEPSRQPCSCPVRDSYSLAFRLRCRCRCYRRGVVWIALMTLLGCCIVTDTSFVLPPPSWPLAATSDSGGGQTSVLRLSRGSLLQRSPPSSSDTENDNIDDGQLYVKNVDSDTEDSSRRRSNITSTITSSARSTNTAQRRLIRKRRTLNSDILCCRLSRQRSTA